MMSNLFTTRPIDLLTIIVTQDPGVSPNSNGLPGLSALKQMVGALLTFGLVVCVAGFVVSAAAWALGSLNSNAHHAGRGKTGCLVAGGAAVLIGSANAIIRFASGVSIN
jgi:hypothetical protein